MPARGAGTRITPQGYDISLRARMCRRVASPTRYLNFSIASPDVHDKFLECLRRIRPSLYFCLTVKELLIEKDTSYRDEVDVAVLFRS